MCVKHIRTKSANSVKYRLAMTVAMAFLIPTTAFAEGSHTEGPSAPEIPGACSIRTGYYDRHGVLQEWLKDRVALNDPEKETKEAALRDGKIFFFWGTGLTAGPKGREGATTCDGLPLDNLNKLVKEGASSDDVNSAIQKLQEEQNAKNNEQDGRLNGHDQQITNINAKDKEQDGRLDGHDQQIAKIEEGAVFYNRDANGKKTGGVTLDDGVSKNGVRLGNVAAAKDGRDAVNLDQLKQSLGGESRTDADGNYVGPKYTVGGVDYGNVGDALAASNSLAVKYTADKNGKPTNNIVLSGDGTGAPVGITNVAAGVNSLDAVNKGQLDGVLGALGGGAKVEHNGSVTAPSYNIGGHNYNDVGSALVATDGRINEIAANNATQFNRLDGRITDVRNDARAGIAGASALAAMRYDDRPGKLSVASGFGGFKDHQAMSVGVGYTTIDSAFRMNAGASYDFQNDGTAWNIGLGWTLN